MRIPRTLPMLELTPAKARVIAALLRVAGPIMSRHRLGWHKVGVKNEDLKAVTRWIGEANAVCRDVIEEDLAGPGPWNRRPKTPQQLREEAQRIVDGE